MYAWSEIILRSKFTLHVKNLHLKIFDLKSEISVCEWGIGHGYIKLGPIIGLHVRVSDLIILSLNQFSTWSNWVKYWLGWDQ